MKFNCIDLQIHNNKFNGTDKLTSELGQHPKTND